MSCAPYRLVKRILWNEEFLWQRHKVLKEIWKLWVTLSLYPIFYRLRDHSCFNESWSFQSFIWPLLTLTRHTTKMWCILRNGLYNGSYLINACHINFKPRWGINHLPLMKIICQGMLHVIGSDRWVVVLEYWILSEDAGRFKSHNAYPIALQSFDAFFKTPFGTLPTDLEFEFDGTNEAHSFFILLIYFYMDSENVLYPGGSCSAHTIYFWCLSLMKCFCCASSLGAWKTTSVSSHRHRSSGNWPVPCLLRCILSSNECSCVPNFIYLFRVGWFI